MPDPDSDRQTDVPQPPIRGVAAYIPLPAQVTGALIDVFGNHKPRWRRMIALFWTALFCFFSLALIAALLLAPNLSDRQSQTMRYLVLIFGVLGFQMLIAARVIGNAEAISQGKHDTLDAINNGAARQANTLDATVRLAVNEAIREAEPRLRQFAREECHDPATIRAMAEAAVRAARDRRRSDGE